MKFVKRVIAFVLLICVCAGGVLVYSGYQKYKEALEETGLETKIWEVQSKPNYTKVEALPKAYTDAVVAVEDHRFYEHPGFDVISLGRALWNDLKAQKLVEGGSTITQQLARNLYFDQSQSMTRKIAEIFMAVQLEKQYDKKEILELYVNNIYFGNGYYCVWDASIGYFQKPPQEMNEYESTLLAGVPNAPSAYAPDKHPELARKRQEKVLDQMVKEGYLTMEKKKSIADMAAQ